jgi:hypothetical protein
MTVPPGGVPPRTGPSRRRLAALAAVVTAVLVAGGIAILFGRSGGGSKAPASCAGKTCPSAGATTVTAVPAGPKLTYRTVDREVGYFEGTVKVVNRTGSPMRAWTLSFTYPGADVHNAWDVVLQQTGQNVIINSAATAQPIAPGDSFEVRFGGAGKPTMPTDCRLNGAPCTFTR